MKTFEEDLEDFVERRWEFLVERLGLNELIERKVREMVDPVVAQIQDTWAQFKLDLNAKITAMQEKISSMPFISTDDASALNALLEDMQATDSGTLGGTPPNLSGSPSNSVTQTESSSTVTQNSGGTSTEASDSSATTEGDPLIPA